MPTAAKAATIDELAEQLTQAKLTIVTDYRGLSVADLQGFRRNLRPAGAEFHIAKNTLTRIAADRVGIDGLAPLLEGPTALVLVHDDLVQASKTVADFVRTSRIMTIRGGVLGTRIIAASDVDALATMPSMEELRGRLVGMLASPMARTLGVLSGPSRSLAYLLNARAEQIGEGAAAAD
ncbi:MAG TPA: 50S ribosomal protein L10 [Thermomicrobiales bacterium]|nr:50S ribosomal protein L10 [Thermomicrobiales bacterium]